VLALEVLQRIEDLLKAKSGRGDFRLADYFDYIAGTSTGASLPPGFRSVCRWAKSSPFYREAGAQMFVKANLLHRLRFKFEDEPLATKLREVFGASTTLGSERLRTLLLLVMRNATTDSPWPISNNPYARYNDTSRQDCNLNFPLWQLVRASTAAPTFFPPEVILLKSSERDKAKEFVFVNGGVTMYNNPAFQMFLMATLDRYWAKKPGVKWRAGADRMLIISIGTGTSPNTQAGLEPDEMNLLFNARTVPSALMAAPATLSIAS
jgi:patatin-like phospholipase/acyl hydrolase